MKIEHTRFKKRVDAAKNEAFSFFEVKIIDKIGTFFLLRAILFVLNAIQPF